MIAQNDNTPLISIICTTYNQEKYIAQALDGFLLQKTSFPIEIIIHDDASTDKTSEIIKEYESKYPNLFITIYQKENQFSNMDVNIWTDITFPLAKGKYIALCEGDDYWINPNKLQLQFDFLEENSDYSVCFHSVKLDFNNKIKNDFLTKVPSRITTIFDLAKKGNYIHTCSCVFRNIKEIFNKIPKKISPGDYALHLFNTLNGEKIWFINKDMAIYRVHSGGLLRGARKEDNLKQELRFYASLLDLFPSAISNLLLFRFILVFTNNYDGFKDQLAKDHFMDFALSLHHTFDKKMLLSIILLKNEIESNRYIAHTLRNRLVYVFNHIGSKNE
jgi:glycosyltransferase involved in cell wall biosynthesis